MWRLRFLSIISPLFVGGCGNDCGPMGASEVGLVAGSDQVTLTYGHLSGLAGNDCPDPSAPAGVISISIGGTQTDGTGLITLCVPRPDQLSAGMRTLGTATSMADVRILDVSGTSNNCDLTFDASRPPTGTASGEGVCGNGQDPSGFAIVIDGAITLRRDCAGTIDQMPVTLRGTVAVAHRSQ
jgi:hypothetical protein